jgi:hypothetical protein
MWYDRDRDMRKRAALVALLLAAITAAAPCTDFEAGVIGGGGLSFLFGTYLDAKAAMLAETGSTVPGSLGRSIAKLFPAWSVGVYGEASLLSWLGLRLEPRFAFMGVSRLALTDTELPFCRYGLSFTTLIIPLLARGKLKLGPGTLTVSAGPFYGAILGEITTVDRYVSTTLTGALTTDFGQVQFLGVSGGAGYSFPLWIGVAALELRADCAITPATSQDGILGGEMFPFGVALAASYGFGFGGGAR